MGAVSARQRNPVTRAFRIVGWMAGASGEAWPLGEIAAGVSMHPATVHRLLGQLVEDGLVRQVPGGAYGLGLEFLRLAWLASGRESLRDVAEPELRALTADTGETSWLGVFQPSRGPIVFPPAGGVPPPVPPGPPAYKKRPGPRGAGGRALAPVPP